MEKTYRLDDGRSASVMLTDDGCAIVSLDLFDEVIEIINNNYKYRWHDLRKNPEDLPEDDCYVLTLVKYFILHAPKEYTVRVFINGKFDADDDELGFEILAWRYIEPFEEVEQ